MTTNTTANNTPLPEEWGERISAFVDGELSPSEAAVVERRLADDPVARRYADELRGISQAFRSAPEPTFEKDLASGVVAEALRRQAEAAVELPDRLEPEGEFGLPFGKSSRNWMWAGVAAAAAVMIFFNGRAPQPQPGGPSLAGQTQQVDRLVAMQQLVPNLRVKDLTPDKMARLQRYLAMQSAQQAKLPGELMTVSQQTAFEPVDPGAVSGEEQLLYIDADEAELDRLLAQAEDVSQVGPDRSQATPAPAAPSKPSVRAVPMRLKITPEMLAKLMAQQKPGAKQAKSGQRRVLVLRIRVQKPAEPNAP